MVEDIYVEALMALRLISLQAKVYLTLVKLGDAKMSQISKMLKVARQDFLTISSLLHNSNRVITV